MKSTGKPILVVSTILLAVALAGCGLFAASIQAKAIEKAIESMGETTESFRYIHRTDLKKQIDAQLPSGKLPDALTERIMLTVPDITKVGSSPIRLNDVPPYDLNASDQEATFRQFSGAAKSVLKRALEEREDLPSQTVSMEVRLAKTGNQWEASFSPASVEKLTRLFEDGMDAAAREILLKNEDYLKLCIARGNRELMTESLGDASYVNAVNINRIDWDGKIFTVDLTLPDPEAVYAAASQKAYETFAAKGKTIYGALGEEEVLKAFQGQLPDAVRSAKKERNLTYRAALEGETIRPEDQIDDFKKEIQTRRKDTVLSVKSRATKTCVIPEAPMPKTGILTGKSTGQSLKISGGKASRDFHIAFYRLPGTDLNAKGTQILTLLLRKGGTITVRLPAGNYKMVQGIGSKWYGKKYTFGPTGHYETSGTLMKIQSGYAYTLDMGAGTKGNLPSKSIPYPYGG